MKRKIVAVVIISGIILALFLLVSLWLPHSKQPPVISNVTQEQSKTITQNQPQTAPHDRPASDSSTSSSPRQQNIERQLTSPSSPTTDNHNSEQYVVINDKRYPLRTYKPLAFPNDPLANQWWVSQTKLDQAWTIPGGDNQTLLAVIDTGFGLNHEEFTNRWYKNVNEIGTVTSENPSNFNCSDQGLPLTASCNLIDDDLDGIVDNEIGTVVYENPSRLNCSDQSIPLTKSCNLIDDDSNGYVDDVTGWDFINHDNSVQAGEINPNGEGTIHGTMVAGVAAASGNNSKGIAGVDWGTTILPIQALDDDAYGNTLSVARAITYAAEQGADVISISLGSTLPDEYVQESIEIALAKGSVVIAASGNDGCECISYPAHYPEVVAVGALDTNNSYADFSSWGESLDILAPGTQITTPTWQASNPTSAYVSGASGTSFSTPMVAGLFTRLLSRQPTMTPTQLTAAVTQSVNRLNLAPTDVHNLRYGFGTLDAQKSTARTINAYSPGLLYAFTPVYKGNYLAPDSPVEVGGAYHIHQCEYGIPSTPIYELKRSGAHFFTSSSIEARHAQAAGYTKELFTYACVQQPHDTPASIRLLNIFSEFRNIDWKY